MALSKSETLSRCEEETVEQFVIGLKRFYVHEASEAVVSGPAAPGNADDAT